MHFARSSPEAFVMQISPDMAKRMLETSPRNRIIRGWWVKLLAAAMKRGEWRVTSNGVGFNQLGELVDAHHRLLAVVEAGVAVPFVVVCGLRQDAYEVIDTGVSRTYADRLNRPRSISDVLRLGCQYATGTAKPTVDQMKPIIGAGLEDAAEQLVKSCNTIRKYYSSAPIKLAACITMMDGGDCDYVLKQYRALALLEFEDMSSASQALVRQVQAGDAVATNPRDALARGFRVFDVERRHVKKIQVSESDVLAAVVRVKSVLLQSVEHRNQHGSRSAA